MDPSERFPKDISTRVPLGGSSREAVGMRASIGRFSRQGLAHGFPLSASSGEVAGTRIAIGALQSGGVWQRISMGELRWPRASSVDAGGRFAVGIVSRR